MIDFLWMLPRFYMWPEHKTDISYLTNLPGASEKLHILNADLDRLDSLEAAIDGCIGVFHVAHPVDFKGVESEETITRRAVEGTVGILKACLKSKSMKRVVYTSSAATVMFNKDQGVTDESTWSDIDFYKSQTITLVASLHHIWCQRQKLKEQLWNLQRSMTWILWLWFLL